MKLKKKKNEIRKSSWIIQLHLRLLMKLYIKKYINYLQCKINTRNYNWLSTEPIFQMENKSINFLKNI